MEEGNGGDDEGMEGEIKALVERKLKGINEQGREVKKEMEGMKKDLKEQERRWREEKRG